MPVILGVIDNAKRGAAIDSAYGYKDAIETHIIEKFDDNIAINENGVYLIDENGNLFDGEDTYNISFNGNAPSKGFIVINNYAISGAKMCINNFSVDYDGNFKISNNNYCTEDSKIIFEINGEEKIYNANNNYNMVLKDIELDNESFVTCNNGVNIYIDDDGYLNIDNILGNIKCNINTSFEEIFNNLDNTTNSVILLSDVTTKNMIVLELQKDINIDLNGHDISYEFDGEIGADTAFLTTYGKLNIYNSSTTTEAKLKSNDVGIRVFDTGVLYMSNIEMEVLRLAIYDRDNYAHINNVNIKCDGTINQCINIAKGELINISITSPNIIGLYVGLERNVSVNNIKCSSNTACIYNAGGKVDLKGDIYMINNKTSSGSYVIGVLKDSGNLNITGKEATFDENGNYISGVYIEGNNGTAVVSYGGKLNINGGLYRSKYRTINGVSGGGIININDGTIENYGSNGATIISQNDTTVNISGNVNIKGDTTLYNIGSGLINICSGNIYSEVHSMSNKSTGYIYYTSNVNFNNTMTTDGSSNIVLNNSLTCK